MICPRCKQEAAAAGGRFLPHPAPCGRACRAGGGAAGTEFCVGAPACTTCDELHTWNASTRSVEAIQTVEDEAEEWEE